MYSQNLSIPTESTNSYGLSETIMNNHNVGMLNASELKPSHDK